MYIHRCEQGVYGGLDGVVKEELQESPVQGWTCFWFGSGCTLISVEDAATTGSIVMVEVCVDWYEFETSWSVAGMAVVCWRDEVHCLRDVHSSSQCVTQLAVYT